ncbi:exodeoxyribonuclease VII small subunit [candidate division KSB1 bacterium]|nr:MAG: exodeoxyribonuclease VII small subunit [candidate division KSB1 bacterium]
MKKKNFEESLKRLEEIIETLERGDLTLEESLEIFREGVELTKFCKEKINSAETEVKKLIKDMEGNFQLEILP